MKVLFISHEASRTGAPIALLQVLLYLKEHCKDIYFEVLLLNGGDLSSEFEKLCVVHRGWLKYSFKRRLLNRLCPQRVIKPYLFLFKQGDFNCIYANSVASFKVAVDLKNKLSIPVIGHVHEAECLMKVYNLSEEVLHSINTYITVSELAANNLVDNYSVDRRNILIQYPISIWVSLLFKGSLSLHKEPCYGNSFNIGLFNNGTWYKSTELTPLIVKTIFDKYPNIDCKFFVAGELDNQTLYRLKYDLKKTKLLDKVIFIGKTDNPMSFLFNMDVFLLASREESFSLAAQEAGSLGKPIIAFEDASGAAEWIKHGAGFVVPYLNLDRLADCIYNLTSNYEIRTSMCNKSKQIVNKMYNENSNFSNIVLKIKNFE